MNSLILNFFGFLILSGFQFINCSSPEKQQQKKETLTLEKTIAFPGVKGRIDHLACNEKKGIVFIAALGNNTVEVADLNKGTQIKTITGFNEPQGIVFIPEFNQIFVSNGGDGSCRIYDASSYELTKTIRLPGDADNVRYDSISRHIYVGYGTGGIAVIDTKNYNQIGDIKLSGHPESFQIDHSSNKIFVNVPDSRLIEVIDLNKNQVIGKWAVHSARANFPMAFDEKSHRLFIGCRFPSSVLVFDSESGKEITSFNCAGDIDDIFYDEVKKLIYLSCGEGQVNLYHQEGKDQYKEETVIETHSGARTALLIPQQNKYIVACPSKNGNIATLKVFTTQ